MYRFFSILEHISPFLGSVFSSFPQGNLGGSVIQSGQPKSGNVSMVITTVSTRRQKRQLGS